MADPSSDDLDSGNQQSGGRLRKRVKTVKEEDTEEDTDMISLDASGGKMSKYETKDQTKERFARENHSEIERRRRNKMNAYISELSDMVPSCNGLPKKPDKLTILKMAVTYIKSLRGGSPPPTEGSAKPSFLSDQELKHLVLEAADGFLFVLACSTGTVVYVSDSITPVLNMSQIDWMNKSIYDLVHPEDREKVKDQLGTEINNETRILDSKTGSVRKDALPGKLSIGSRRNFIIRMRCGKFDVGIDDPDSRMHEIKNRCKEKRKEYDGEEYAFVHCTGYVPSFSPSMMQDLDADESNCYLVCIGRMQSTDMASSKDNDAHTPATEFITRHTTDGRFSFADKAVYEILGYKPMELFGKNCYDFYHPDNQEEMFCNFKQVLAQKGQPLTAKFKFRHKNGEYVVIRASCYSFQNPYTDEPECIICTNSPVRSRTEKGPSTKSDDPMSSQEASPGSPRYNDVTSMLQELPGVFPYSQSVVDSGRFSHGSGMAVGMSGEVDESDRGKGGSKRKMPGPKAKKVTKPVKVDYGEPDASEHIPNNNRFLQQNPFGDFSNSQAGEMLKALARRRQEQTHAPLDKSSPQYEQGMYGSGPGWSGSGQYSLPGADGAAYEGYMETSHTPQGGHRQQSSPYNLPVSEINIARQIMQSSGSHGYDQTVRSGMPYASSSAGGPDMPQSSMQTISSTSNAPQKPMTYQQQQQQGLERSDMRFMYYQ
eukprot:gene10123-11157_t